MGDFTRNLFKKNRTKNPKPTINVGFDKSTDDTSDNCIVSCAIIRNGETHSGWKSHAEIRRFLGDSDPYKSKKTDFEGFLTRTGEVVSRCHAAVLAHESGQISRVSSRDLLSSDLNWWGKPKKE